VIERTVGLPFSHIDRSPLVAIRVGGGLQAAAQPAVNEMASDFRGWYGARCSRLERNGCEPELAGFREHAFGQNAVDGPLVNRIVHNRFWHENAWL
jgi:hypothetical protein